VDEETLKLGRVIDGWICCGVGFLPEGAMP
jgi:hypothetical protein